MCDWKSRFTSSVKRKIFINENTMCQILRAKGQFNSSSKVTEPLVFSRSLHTRQELVILLEVCWRFLSGTIKFHSTEITNVSHNIFSAENILINKMRLFVHPTTKEQDLANASLQNEHLDSSFMVFTRTQMVDSNSQYEGLERRIERRLMGNRFKRDRIVRHSRPVKPIQQPRKSY